LHLELETAIYINTLCLNSAVYETGGTHPAGQAWAAEYNLRA